MLTRIIVAAAMAVVLVPFLFISDTVWFVLLIALLAVAGEFEMLRCLGLHKNIFISIPVYFLAAAGPAAARYCDSDRFFRFAFPAVALAMVFILAVYTFSEQKVSLEHAGTAATACIYIASAFTSIVLLRDVPVYGYYLFLAVFIASWMTDIFAYFCGMLFGKHKLIPSVSPKKTVEGSIGGIVFCAIAFAVYGILLNRFVGSDIVMNYPILIVVGILSSVVSQAGDLMMSAIKRSQEVKDYSNIFPGHGGVLDRFDSVLAVSVVLLACETLTDIFG